MIEIGGLQKTTLIDYPGCVACTVFLINCNFRCPWCYSLELVLPEKIAAQPRVKKEDFFSFLEERKGKLEGVVVCGGEPTVNQDLPEFISLIKEMNFKVKLDTNGSNPEMIEKLIKLNLVDYFAMDIKNSFNNCSKAIGKEIDVDLIKKSIKIIMDSGVDYEFRTTVVPNLHEKKDILEIAQFIKGADKYFLQKFRPGKEINSNDNSEEYLKEIVKEIQGFFNVCEARY